ncbi:polyphosphate polymerase domain-containing protein [Pelagicoccus sp. SDUM812003]|uniref:polyphosphate polymerase domain-containing protein n=1 Tax=Pelagicoccus sp. SDUM812003 TaxID=3041267 RepID=UPI00280D3CED|nr:polyphosphate polymerase domain-containing protein [Pelagicoccus sp. SDUM812003]MDQ8202836.1 polyphosphate polymerase domain-containing protein [Pelagicoccus sp. SDUM812003]
MEGTNCEVKQDNPLLCSSGGAETVEAPQPLIAPPRIRHELKYIVPERYADEIREYLQVFCEPDSFAQGEPPVYTVSTLQLDTPALSLHFAKERKQVNRFKLRVRTYGEEPAGTVFFEVKRKEENYVRKTRSRVAVADYGPHCFGESPMVPRFKTEAEAMNHYEFLRLYRSLGALPMAHIRYERESWIGNPDTSVRITMDRRIRYRRAKDFSLHGLSKLPWRSMDTQVALRRPFAGFVLEMKCSLEVPTWILYLVRKYNLERSGFCKYSTAMRLESLFLGDTYTAGSERCFG